MKPLAFGLAFAAFCLPVAHAQEFPARPVRLIVPFSAGGPADGTARLAAAQMSAAWGQQVVVDNRAGGSGIIGTEIVAHAVPDGYTLICISSAFTINATLFSKLPYDSIKDFTAIAPLSYGPALLVVHPSVPVKTMKELIALAKTKPLVYGSSGTGSPGHITFELFKRMSGVEITHIPYRGMGPALVDLLGGQVQMAAPGISVALPHVKSGRLRSIAVTSVKRWPTVPDVPTVAESALPGFESVLWYGIIGPARMPAVLVGKINTEATRAMDHSDVRDKLEAGGMGPMKMQPAEYASYIKAEIAKHAKVVKESGARPD